MTMVTPVLLLFALFSGPVEDGLWRLSVPEDPEMVFYLFADGEAEPSLYDSAWRQRFLDEVKVEEEKMYLRTIPTSNLQMFEFEITFSGTSVTGNMKSRVMQYEVFKSLVGVRLSSEAPELPEQAMEWVRQAGPESFTRELCEEANDKSLSEFQQLWTDEFFPRYYAVLEPLFFKKGIVPSSEHDYVQRVYEQVKGWDVESCLPDSTQGFLLEEDAEASASPSEVIVKLPSALLEEEASFTFATFRNVDRCCSQPEFLTEEIRLLPVRCDGGQGDPVKHSMKN